MRLSALLCLLSLDVLAQDAGSPPGCPDGMTLIPAGAFGQLPQDLSHLMGRRVAAFCLDTTRVSVEAYKKVVPRPKGTTLETAEDDAAASPQCNGPKKDKLKAMINCVDQRDAASFCKSQGKRLPTDSEYFWAALGGKTTRRFPWGNTWDPKKWCDRSDCVPGATAGSATPLGVHDLAGAEWVSSGLVAFGISISSNEGIFEFMEAHEPQQRTTAISFRCVLPKP